MPVPPSSSSVSNHNRYPSPPISFLKYGEWDLEGIDIVFKSKNKAIIQYRKYGREDYYPLKEKYISLNFLDRLKGMTLEQKLERVFSNLIDQLSEENAQFRKRKAYEKELRKKIKSKKLEDTN